MRVAIIGLKGHWGYYRDGLEALPQHQLAGVAEEDVHLELKDDILIVVAAKGEKKYRKEVLLPASFTSEKMTYTCRNGVLEVRLAR